MEESADQLEAMQQPTGADRTPADYKLWGYPNWRIGKEPKTPEDWALELRLYYEGVQQGTGAGWASGKQPENDREWQIEYSFRQLENQRKNDQGERELRYNVMVAGLQQAARGTNVRSWVLLAIVTALILMPIIGMVSGMAAQTFSQFVAPVTGIGGTVLGYWFSQQNTSVPSDIPPVPQDRGTATPNAPSFPKPPEPTP